MAKPGASEWRLTTRSSGSRLPAAQHPAAARQRHSMVQAITSPSEALTIPTSAPVRAPIRAPVHLDHQAFRERGLDHATGSPWFAPPLQDDRRMSLEGVDSPASDWKRGFGARLEGVRRISRLRQVYLCVEQ